MKDVRNVLTNIRNVLTEPKIMMVSDRGIEVNMRGLDGLGCILKFSLHRVRLLIIIVVDGLDRTRLLVVWM